MLKSIAHRWMLFAGLALAIASSVTHAQDAVPARSLKIVVASDAPAAVQQAARLILAAVNKSPVLKIMGGDSPPNKLTTSDELLKAKPDVRAYSHLVIVGLPDDPLVIRVWQHEARNISVNGAAGLYVFGFGSFQGDLGYIESDRNPFLHAVAIKRAPFESEIVTITGSTPHGVQLAAEAFVRDGLLNGVIGGLGYKRSETSLLDRDPLAVDFTLSNLFAPKLGKWTLAGVTQASEDEYRGVLEDTGVEPQSIWRAKYFTAGVWDGAGYGQALEDYNAGLHRRSYGNTLWVARFASQTQASAAAVKIANAAKLKKSGKKESVWAGQQPPLGPEKENSKRSDGPLSLWQQNDSVWMSTLPAEVSNEADHS